MIESLAEHAFHEFRDARTPEDGLLRRLLPIVEEEQDDYAEQHCGQPLDDK